MKNFLGNQRADRRHLLEDTLAPKMDEELCLGRRWLAGKHLTRSALIIACLALIVLSVWHSRLPTVSADPLDLAEKNPKVTRELIAGADGPTKPVEQLAEELFGTISQLRTAALQIHPEPEN